MNQAAPELVPCPFCGNPPSTKKFIMRGHHAMRIWCDECSVSPTIQSTENNALEAWNTRAAQPSPDRAELEEAIDNVLIAGNHLATALYLMKIIPEKYKTYDEVLEIHYQPGADVWIAWKRAMELRAAHEAARAHLKTQEKENEKR